MSLSLLSLFPISLYFIASSYFGIYFSGLFGFLLLNTLLLLIQYSLWYCLWSIYLLYYGFLSMLVLFFILLVAILTPLISDILYFKFNSEKATEFNCLCFYTLFSILIGLFTLEFEFNIYPYYYLPLADLCRSFFYCWVLEGETIIEFLAIKGKEEDRLVEFK